MREAGNSYGVNFHMQRAFAHTYGPHKDVTDLRLVLGRVAEEDIEAEIVRHGGARGRFPPSKRSRPTLAREMLNEHIAHAGLERRERSRRQCG